ncbi:MAG: hypothetical protein GIW99_03505 [Candidatus Eremiobacteraeota bacterium]|nr:hypothetical protein [Candidatus Eremiobacteraeota bacterium]MBC5826739.1 hypothetical protein [Candidatus Eremiobacteraeota bacterium]
MPPERSDPQQDWVNAHLGRTSKEVAKRLLSSRQPPPRSDSPVLTLRGVQGRCVAGGASNFWIIGSPAAEPVFTGDYPLTDISPTAYFILAPEFNNLPYCIDRNRLTATNHSIRGDLQRLETAMREVYG